jgi:hypothetical protein
MRGPIDLEAARHDASARKIPLQFLLLSKLIPEAIIEQIREDEEPPDDEREPEDNTTDDGEEGGLV